MNDRGRFARRLTQRGRVGVWGPGPVCLLFFWLWMADPDVQAHSVLRYTAELQGDDDPTSIGSSGEVQLYFEPDDVLGERRATYFIRLNGLDLDGTRSPRDAGDDVLGIRIRIGDPGQDAPHALNIYGSLGGQLREDDDNMIVSASLGEVSGIWSDGDETFTGVDGARLPVDSVGISAAVDDLLQGRLFVEVATVRRPAGELHGQLMPVPTSVDLKFFPGAGFQFTFNVYSPRLIRVESTTSFSSWSLVTNLVATNSLVRSLDFAASVEKERFYRISELYFVHPSILDPPEATTAVVGETVMFHVVADGVPEPVYQWYFEGEPLFSATSSTLEVESVGWADAGAYSVGVFSAAGSVYSEPVQLTVLE